VQRLGESKEGRAIFYATNNGEVLSAVNARGALALRLRARGAEIEEAIVARIAAVADRSEREDAEYLAAQRETIGEAVAYGLAGIEWGEELCGPIPVSVVAQARRAARRGVALDTVLRRCRVAERALGDFVIEEAAGADFAGGAHLLRGVLRTQASLIDGLEREISDGYRGEAHRLRRSPGQRQLERVRRLLAGRPVEGAELGYELQTRHVAMIAMGEQAEAVLRGIVVELDHRALIVRRDGDVVWAWLGGRERLDGDRIAGVLSGAPEVSLAMGEPGEGTAGWRTTHRQAEATLPVARQAPGRPTRYADVALLASACQDELLCGSLIELYLSPLDAVPNGPLLRHTLRCYILGDRQITSAAARLGMDRRTVANHLRAVEDLLGRRLPTCAAEIGMAFRLEEIRRAAV
jgi:hypothetical protein